MHEYGFLSLLPPLIAIVLAIRTKQVFISLLFGIWLGWVIINGGNILTGTFDTVEALVHVFADAGNTRTIMFAALVGALIIFIQRSGGVEGFILGVNRLLAKYEERQSGSNKVIVQFFSLADRRIDLCRVKYLRPDRRSTLSPRIRPPWYIERKTRLYCGFQFRTS